MQATPARGPIVRRKSVRYPVMAPEPETVPIPELVGLFLMYKEMDPESFIRAAPVEKPVSPEMHAYAMVVSEALVPKTINLKRKNMVYSLDVEARTKNFILLVRVRRMSAHSLDVYETVTQYVNEAKIGLELATNITSWPAFIMNARINGFVHSLDLLSKTNTPILSKSEEGLEYCLKVSPYFGGRYLVNLTAPKIRDKQVYYHHSEFIV